MADDGGVRSREKGSTLDVKEVLKSMALWPGGVDRPDRGVNGPKLEEAEEKLRALDEGYPMTWLSKP